MNVRLSVLQVVSAVRRELKCAEVVLLCRHNPFRLVNKSELESEARVPVQSFRNIACQNISPSSFLTLHMHICDGAEGGYGDDQLLEAVIRTGTFGVNRHADKRADLFLNFRQLDIRKDTNPFSRIWAFGVDLVVVKYFDDIWIAVQHFDNFAFELGYLRLLVAVSH